MDNVVSNNVFSLNNLLSFCLNSKSGEREKVNDPRITSFGFFEAWRPPHLIHCLLLYWFFDIICALFHSWIWFYVKWLYEAVKQPQRSRVPSSTVTALTAQGFLVGIFMTLSSLNRLYCRHRYSVISLTVLILLYPSRWICGCYEWQFRRSSACIHSKIFVRPLQSLIAFPLKEAELIVQNCRWLVNQQTAAGGRIHFGRSTNKRCLCNIGFLQPFNQWYQMQKQNKLPGKPVVPLSAWSNVNLWKIESRCAPN